VNGESQTRKELTPSPFPLPCGERIEVRGKRKFLYYFINNSRFTKYDSPVAVTQEIVLRYVLTFCRLFV